MTDSILKRLSKPTFLAPLLGIFLISACDTISMDSLNIFTERPPMLCPGVNILAKSERLTIFKDGPGRDIIDINTEALIDDFQARCIYQVDDDTQAGQILVELSVGFTVSRGPANLDGTIDLPYFVTILDNDKNVLTKSVFHIKTTFEGNRYRLSGYDEPVILSIPVAPPISGNDFEIYLGFQLTPAQLKYNQSSG